MLVFVSGYISAQTINEKQVYEGLRPDPYSLYDFSYDYNTGSFVYSSYDTVTQKSRVSSNKGNSNEYSYLQTSDIVYDNSGNYFAVAINTHNDESYTADHYFLKNGKEILSSSNIQSPILRKDDGIYFVANVNGKDTRVKYNFAAEQLEYGKSYDTIFLAAMRVMYGEGEPATEIGFTKSGKEYYAASKNGKHIFVVGDTEYGPYDEIIYYNAFEDKNGDICFVAKEIIDGKNYYSVVQGDKKYKKFASIYLTSAFDNDNTPVYSASENFDELYPMDAYLVKGNEIVSRNFSKGAYDILFTPSGKLVYTGSDTLTDGTYVTKMFIDGKEYASASSIYNITFFNDDTPFYYASDANYNTALYKGKTKITDDAYSNINSYNVNKSGILSYSAMIYGDYDKGIPNKSYYIIGNEKFGPFENIYVGEYEVVSLLVNDYGDYLYTASSSKPGSEGEPVTKYSAVGKSWKSPEFDFVGDLKLYNNDFYYTGYNYNDEGTKNSNILYKNGQKLAEYNSVTNLKLDDKKGLMTFLAQRDNKVYYVEIIL